MPDRTTSPEALAARARRAAEIARRDRVVERCGPAGPTPHPASLTWTTFGMDIGGMQTAGDGRYLVASEPRGYVAKVYQDSKELLVSDIYASRREACAWCQGVEDWRAMVAKEMERTAEHEPLKVEVVEDVA